MSQAEQVPEDMPASHTNEPEATGKLSSKSPLTPHKTLKGKNTVKVLT